MNRTILSLCLLFIAMAGMAQENKPFVMASVGTQVTDKAFRGADVSMQAGYNFKGLDISAQLDYYSNHWGRSGVNSMTYEVRGNNSLLMTTEMDNKRYKTYMTLRLNLGYDVLRFIHGNWRHHLRPYVGFGYSLCDGTSSLIHEEEGMTQYGMVNWRNDGFEFSLGGAYDFNITQNWAVGAFIEGNPLVREQPIMGLRLRYSF